MVTEGFPEEEPQPIKQESELTRAVEEFSEYKKKMNNSLANRIIALVESEDIDSMRELFDFSLELQAILMNSQKEGVDIEETQKYIDENLQKFKLDKSKYSLSKYKGLMDNFNEELNK